MQRIRLTSGNNDVVIISANNDTKALPGIFTVNTNGKKVKFSPGNLFWDGSKFDFEKHQYDFPTAWDASHVGHFFWSKDATVARAEICMDESVSETDTFFATDDGAVDGFTVLSGDEWQYLIDNAMVKSSGNPKIVTINGKKCVVLKSDFNCAVADNYTAEEWKQAESQLGLVALPFAGTRYASSIGGGGSYGSCWSGTPSASYSDYAYSAYFDSSYAYTHWYNRNRGYSVRLVSVQ